MSRAECPDCGRSVETGGRRLGQRFACSRCRAAIVVISRKPAGLGWASGEDEDERLLRAGRIRQDSRFETGSKLKHTRQARCAACGDPIAFSSLAEGRKVTCPWCSTGLEAARGDPERRSSDQGEWADDHEMGRRRADPKVSAPSFAYDPDLSDHVSGRRSVRVM